MSGTKSVFDTNTLINFLRGYPALQEYTKANIFISVVSIIEFLAYPQINSKEKDLLFSFLEKITVVNLAQHDAQYINLITEIRKTTKIKLPDAIIAATALLNNATLITSDKDFTRIPTLTVVNY